VPSAQRVPTAVVQEGSVCENLALYCDDFRLQPVAVTEMVPVMRLLVATVPLTLTDAASVGPVVDPTTMRRACFSVYEREKP
jgi:hypothetical protein